MGVGVCGWGVGCRALRLAHVGAHSHPICDDVADSAPPASFWLFDLVNARHVFFNRRYRSCVLGLGGPGAQRALTRPRGVGVYRRVTA